MKKLLSICIPTYNRYYYVSKLVDHILAFNKELFRDIDIIVSDNSSTDETQSFFVELTRKKISHLKYHRNDINIGATRNLEQVKNLAKSRYVWWLGDDDWIEENNATQVLEKLREQECSILLLDRCVVFSDREKEESLFSHYFAKSVSFTLSSTISEDPTELSAIFCKLTALSAMSVFSTTPGFIWELLAITFPDEACGIKNSYRCMSSVSNQETRGVFAAAIIVIRLCTCASPSVPKFNASKPPGPILWS